MTEKETLFTAIQEALETLANEADYADTSDSGQGLDANREILNEGLQALGTIRSLLRDVAPTLRERHENCIAEGKENCAFARLVSEVL